MLLPWVLSTVALLSAVHGSRGFDVSPSCETSSSIPHIKDRASSLMYLTKLHRMYAPSPVTLPKGSASHSPIVSPPKVGEMSPTMQAVIPSAQLSNPSSRASVEHKWPRLISPSIESQAPNVPLGAGPATSPNTSPVNFPSAPSLVISPAPHEVTNTSNTTHAPLPSQPGSSPMISPMVHEVKNPSNATHAPLTSLPSISPVMSPAPHEVENPFKPTHAPLTSHLVPSPAISPMPHEVKNHSNITHAPSTTHPAPSSVISSSTHDVKNPSNTTHAPSTSHPAPSPVISPSTHDGKNPSNTTHAPSTSTPAPSPVISPAPHDVKNPSNATQAPSTSQPAPSPMISPAPHEVKNPSNATQAPSTSQPAPSPMISPAPHDVKNPSNATQAPSTSHPAPSPMISPAPHDVKNPSNSTQPPSSPHPAPHVISPTPHDVKNPPNATHASSTSHPAPSPHDVKNPPNSTHAPLSSHPAPPVISLAPPDVKNSSNKTQGPLTSHPAPSPVISPAPHESKNPSKAVHAPLSSHRGSSPAISPSILHSPASAPAISNHQHAAKKSVGNPASAPFSVMPPSSYHQVEGPVISPAPLQPPVLPKDRRTRHAPPFYVEGPSPSPIPAPFSSTDEGAPTSTSSTTHRQNRWPIPSPILSPSGSFSRKPRTPAPQPVQAFPPPPNLGPIDSPTISPSGSSSRKPRTPPPHVWVLPPPPPNSDCNSLTCSEPLTNAPPGAPCACVLPINVKLRLGVALYTFFPLVSELAQEIAAGIFMKQSQVRIMGANAASDEPEKTIVLIDLVPLGRYFDSTTAFLIYQRFWHKQVAIQASYFGDYDVLYVLYPGLPPSPPTAPADLNVDDGAYGNSNNARAIHPLGVDVPKRKEKISGSLIAIIVLSSVIAMLLIIGSAWFLVLKRREHARLPPPTSQTLLPTFAKPSVAGTRPTIFGSGPSSTSSSIATYTGSAKTFSLVEIERTTNRFDDSRIIGEGGFGRVYQGTLEDGTRVAVKVLKRDDQQGGREFLAEVEMLSRLHHRNLVKLIGICTEDVRCLVYELIPNGSVESHLHGVNKETAPLDWSARVKIALGAARGLAYLHEDSSPCVIHRDFKSSNILLEHDFTPKVSDFGLARTAVDEGNEHISTRVMGTFGYVAPEYAMTGHLLVKSDVYSYGVVLLELLTGRKPVDMSQPPGQENLVTWARPLLTSLDGLETIIDPALGVDVSFDSVAKVAAIASMCVQPEVSHRPFMGEVVQALKLVCNESDEHNRASGSCSQDELPAPDTDMRISMGLGLEAERVLSASDIFSTSARFTVEASRSSRRQSSSGPLTTGGSRQFWRRVRDLSGGSMSEHGFALRFGTGLDGHEQWP